MIAASDIPAKVALSFALEPVTNRRKVVPKALSTAVLTILIANRIRIIAPASSRRNWAIAMLKSCPS